MTEFDPNEKVEFEEVVAALRNENEPFPARYLFQLSGLEAEQLEIVQTLWPRLSAQRRLGLLEDMELLSESNTVVHFDALSRLALGDEEADVRAVAVRSLWQSERGDLVPLFIEIMEGDEEYTTSAQAASALGRFVYLGELGKISAELSEQAVERLLAAMASDAHPLVRRRALEALGYSGHEGVPDLIEEAYEFRDEDWQASALFAMGRSADDRWAPLVLERLDDPSAELSKEAARAAGELQLNDALMALINLLHDDVDDVRMAAAWALSQIGGPRVRESLEELLERSDDEDEIDLIENALENLAFNEELDELNIFDFSPQDLEDLIETEDPRSPETDE